MDASHDGAMDLSISDLCKQMLDPKRHRARMKQLAIEARVNPSTVTRWCAPESHFPVAALPALCRVAGDLAPIEALAAEFDKVLVDRDQVDARTTSAEGVMRMVKLVGELANALMGDMKIDAREWPAANAAYREITALAAELSAKGPDEGAAVTKLRGAS